MVKVGNNIRQHHHLIHIKHHSIFIIKYNVPFITIGTGLVAVVIVDRTGNHLGNCTRLSFVFGVSEGFQLSSNMTQQDKPKQQKNKNQNNSNSNNNNNSNSNSNSKTNKKKKNSKSRPSLSEDEVNTQSEGHHLCIVCFSSLGTNIRAKLACNHDDICGICHLRLRYLNEDKKCPICKQTNDTIIVDRYPEKKFDDYNRWGDEIGAGFVYKENVGMFFEESYFNESITPLFDLSCHKCDFTIDETTIKNTGGGGKKNRPQRLLMDHLRAKHRLSMCYLCIDHKRDFISQLPKFTAGQLQKHLKEGDGPGSGFSGHPLCEFCHPKRFYDVTFLHQHLNKEHYKCHICEKQGIDNQWFKNYRSLARHFDKQHFMCHDVQCLEARFVVFENELDLRAHGKKIAWHWEKVPLSLLK